MNDKLYKKATEHIWFYKGTYKLFQEGLEILKERYEHVFESYQSIADDFDLRQDPLEEAKKHVKHLDRMIKNGREMLDDPSRDRVTVRQPSFISLKFLKAGGKELIKRYESKREALLFNNRKDIPRLIVKAIDDKIRQLYDVIEQGALNGLNIDDEFLQIYHDQKEASKSNQEKKEPKKVVIESNEIPIIDEELRERCLRILRIIIQEGDYERLDTVVREMSVVLEDRIKSLSGVKNKTAIPLINKVFSSKNPILKFGDKEIQKNMLLLFKSYFGFFRNKPMHELIDTYEIHRVYQLLGHVDNLLFILTQAELQDEVIEKN